MVIALEIHYEQMNLGLGFEKHLLVRRTEVPGSWVPVRGGVTIIAIDECDWVTNDLGGYLNTRRKRSKRQKSISMVWLWSSVSFKCSHAETWYTSNVALEAAGTYKGSLVCGVHLKKDPRFFLASCLTRWSLASTYTSTLMSPVMMW